jgi:hypothetical protein
MQVGPEDIHLSPVDSMHCIAVLLDVVTVQHQFHVHQATKQASLGHTDDPPTILHIQ